MTRYLNAIVAAIATGVFLLPSCAPRRAEIELDTAAVDAARLLSIVRERASLVNTLEGRGTLSFEGPEFGGTASFELSLRKPDSLLVIFEGPFGIDVGTLFLSRDKYVVYSSMENLVVTGVPRTRAIRTVIPFDLSVDQILNAFSGAAEIPDIVDAIHAYRIEGDRFLVSVRCGDRICSYWIDNTNLQVTKYEVREEDGGLVLQATSAAFTEEGEASAPRRIVVGFPQKERQVSVYYTSLTLNPPNPSFAYSLPADARTIVR